MSPVTTGQQALCRSLVSNGKRVEAEASQLALLSTLVQLSVLCLNSFSSALALQTPSDVIFMHFFCH